MECRIALQAEPLQLQKEWAWLQNEAGVRGAGAIATFVGCVRPQQRRGKGRVRQLLLEAYEKMARADMERIAADAAGRWPALQAVSLVHRTGAIGPGEVIVFVGVASAHRPEAHAACEYLVDCLKSQVALWKKEVGEDGARWLEPSADDLRRLQRWS